MTNRHAWLAKCIFTLTVLVLGGCASLRRPAPVIGDSVETIQTKLGRPTNRYRQPSMGAEQTELEYATGPYGQETWIARFGADGTLVSYEQVLTTRGFAMVKLGVSTKQDVLYLLGRPAETSYLSWPDLTVWSYRYKEADVWDSMMHVQFDRNGVVRKMDNGPDPAREELRWPFF